MPIPPFALLLPLADLTWEQRSVTVEAEPGQAVIEASFAFENAGYDAARRTGS